MDYMVDLLEFNGYKNILIITDRLSKKIILILVPKNKFNTLRFIELFLKRYIF